LTRRAAVDAEAPGAPSAAGGRTRPFADLSPAGKQRRVAALALAALERYDLRVRSVRVHAFATNLLYRVRSDTGERLMLRMAVPGWRTLSDLEAEAAWLEALQRETDLGAPAVVRASSGEAVLSMRAVGLGAARQRDGPLRAPPRWPWPGRPAPLVRGGHVVAVPGLQPQQGGLGPPGLGVEPALAAAGGLAPAPRRPRPGRVGAGPPRRRPARSA
jgi:hypothetical protein